MPATEYQPSQNQAGEDAPSHASSPLNKVAIAVAVLSLAVGTYSVGALSGLKQTNARLQAEVDELKLRPGRETHPTLEPTAEAEVTWKNLQAEVTAVRRELQQSQAEAKQQYDNAKQQFENAKQLLASAKAQPSPAQPEKPANDLNNQIKRIDTMSQKLSKLEKDFTDSDKRIGNRNTEITEKFGIIDSRFSLITQDISTLKKEVRSTAHTHTH
jgi:multidrug efflux pump subunit AcrA (membrane-fusion protein)